MKLVELNWNPPNRQLRQFGAIAAVVLPAVGWWRGAGSVVLATLVLVGVALAVVGWFVPRAIRPVFLALMIVAIPIGMLIGELSLLAIYFGVFLPIGLCFRLLKRDSLKLRPERERATYWDVKAQPTGIASYYRQS